MLISGGGDGDENIKIIRDYRSISESKAFVKNCHSWNVRSLIKVYLPKPMFHTVYIRPNNCQKFMVILIVNDYFTIPVL